MDELEVDLWKRIVLHQKRDVDNYLYVEKKEDGVECHTCGTKEEKDHEDEKICEPEVEEDEKEEEDHEDDNIFEPKVDDNDFLTKTTTIEEE